MRTDVTSKARQASDSPVLKVLARVGLIAYGAVNLLIGWLALQMAWGAPDGKSADSAGALKTLVQQPLGLVLLWLLAVGLVALALWQAAEAIWGYHGGDAGKRVRSRLRSGVKAVLYAGVGVSAISVAVGSPSKSDEQTTAGVFGWPGGQWIVLAVALIIVGVGVDRVVKAVKRSFGDEIDTSSMTPAARSGVMRLGQFGYLAHGAALFVLGGLLGYAALTFDPQKSKGLDGALQTILEQPYGKFLLTAVALGFVAYGLFAMLQARYRRL
ncbi:MAG TPA: DUF1206 domain-containing protein [Cryptosporangiaceae bacterium]|nr:DUF1206 domain-containing protein [Cryptosporangiaceae bacterium]